MKILTDADILSATWITTEKNWGKISWIKDTRHLPVLNAINSNNNNSDQFYVWWSLLDIYVNMKISVD